jgi:uncharacterized protein YecE (DUF72 family)
VTGALRIGTSGWHYKHWRGNFYPDRFPASKMLERYVQSFDAVELNNTFYRLPPESAVESWRDSTPENFLFAVKGSRFLTHMKKLNNPESGIDRFFERAELLGSKLGPVLFQLPPKWGCHPGRLELFLNALPQQHRYAFEFRDPTWNAREVLDILTAHNAAYCIFDLAGYQTPLTVTANFTYIRLHGPGGKYQGSYSDEALQQWASRICEWRQEGKDVFVFFDNDDSGFAAANALTLRRQLS